MTDTKDTSLKNIIEAALFAANRPLPIDQLLSLFPENEQPERSQIREVLQQLQQDYLQHGIELVQVASGYRFQIKQELAPWIKRLWNERPPRHSRALLETLAIIAYRQPVTRSEIETIRGISVNPDILKKLLEYNWIRVLAHRDSPGRPALYGTTRHFLDYFNLKTLNDLPPLAELKTRLPHQEEMFADELVGEPDKPNQENAQLNEKSEKLESEVEQLPLVEQSSGENARLSETPESEVEQLSLDEKPSGENTQADEKYEKVDSPIEPLPK